MPPQTCTSCGETVEAQFDAGEGHSFCPACGLQLEDVFLQSGPTFVQDGNFSHLAGTIVREDDLGREGGTIAGYAGARERSASRGKTCIRNFANQLEIPEASTYIEQAARLYQLAMSSGFTRGRRVNQVAAACLYIVLRQDRRPYLLIDFCKLVSVNVYVLGSTYLRLSETLRLSTHPVQVCLVDPSLYIHRFAGKLKLPQQKQSAIVNTSMHFIATMKRDWMQTGRRPAGVCGAALFLACHVHGIKVSRRDIIKVVSVGESTILHRIAEMKNTSSSSMSLEEFQEHAKQCHQDQLELEGYTGAEGEIAPVGLASSRAKCRHVLNSGVPELAMGMCKTCFSDYVKSSGGIVQGAEDPPAFKRNLCKEIKVMKRQANEEAIKLLTSIGPQRPGSIAGSIAGLSEVSPDNVDGCNAGASDSQALVCQPSTSLPHAQAGCSHELLLLTEPLADNGQSSSGQAVPSGDARDHCLTGDADPEGAQEGPTVEIATGPHADTGAAGDGDPLLEHEDNANGNSEKATKSNRSKGRVANKRLKKGSTRRERQQDNGNVDVDGDDEWQASEQEKNTDSDDEYAGNTKPARSKEKSTIHASKAARPNKRRGRPPKKRHGMEIDASLEAEFALAVLQNENLQTIVHTLQISNAELPAFSVDEAKELLANSQDPLAEAQAAAAAAVQEREAAVRDLEQARAEHRAAPPDAEHEAMLLRVSKFLEVQKGTDLGLANDAMAQIVTEDMQLRAEDLAAQNADMTDFASMDPSKKVSKRPRFGGLLAEDVEDAANAERDEGDEEEDGAPRETFSDLDDDEIDACILSKEESVTKKAVWDRTFKSYMEIKAAKDAAAAASEEDPQASKKKKARKKPIIQFQQGATAQESVERMLQSKNLDDRLNRQQLTELFASADAITRGEGGNSAYGNDTDVQLDDGQPSSYAQQIRQAQDTIANSETAKIDKQQAALMREQSGLQGGLFDSLTRSAVKPKRPLRLGRLR